MALKLGNRFQKLQTGYLFHYGFIAIFGVVLILGAYLVMQTFPQLSKKILLIMGRL